MNKAILLVVVLLTNVALGLQPQATPYYGADFYSQVLHKYKNVELKNALKKILKSGHIREPNAPDQIVENCDSQKNCTMHTAVGYDKARSFIFGKFYLVKLDEANYGIKEKYCDRIYQKEDFKRGQLPGPGIVPDSTIINVEHTWPQSKFTGRYPKEMQKSDLHHLFPTDSTMNSLRGNTIFGEVQNDNGPTKCSASRYGSGSAGSKDIYEPPTNHKGDVARALFYFAIRYDMQITPEEETILKKWNNEHPVDAEEMAHNEAVAQAQGNRNPFIDFPDLANEIADF